jgi:hypothetical protein
VLVATFAALLATVGPALAEPAAPAPPDSVLAELLAVANRIDASSDPFLGRTQIGDLEHRLALTDATVYPARAAALRGQLSFEHLRLGEIEKGAQHMEKVFAMARERKLTPTPLMHRLRIMVERPRTLLAPAGRKYFGMPLEPAKVGYLRSPLPGSLRIWVLGLFAPVLSPKGSIAAVSA